MSEHILSALEKLCVRFDSIAEGRDPGGDSAAAHRAVLAHLDANATDARRMGWTGITLRRWGGMGRLYLEGMSPANGGRGLVPDSGALN